MKRSKDVTTKREREKERKEVLKGE
jgi:hypothetical protein